MVSQTKASAISQTCGHTGDAALSFSDTTLAAETCEELFTPRAPHIALSLSGVEIISNGSGSHHQLRCGQLDDERSFITILRAANPGQPAERLQCFICAPGSSTSGWT